MYFLATRMSCGDLWQSIQKPENHKPTSGILVFIHATIGTYLKCKNWQRKYFVYFEYLKVYNDFLFMTVHLMFEIVLSNRYYKGYIVCLWSGDPIMCEQKHLKPFSVSISHFILSVWGFDSNGTRYGNNPGHNIYRYHTHTTENYNRLLILYTAWSET